jgi:diphthamide biosynthesis enzyme Dph1/Dph2-like protein
VKIKKSYPKKKYINKKKSGETLGCTAPILKNIDTLIFVADGRFHLEACMIQNPGVKAFRYDPYSKFLSFESYDSVKMKEIRLFFFSFTIIFVICYYYYY